MATNSRSRSGQAMVEFCIGLIAVLTVVSGVFQLGRLGLARTSARVEATRLANVESISPPFGVDPRVVDYVRSVEDGRDERSYSVDDLSASSVPEDVYVRILEANRSHLLDDHAPGNPLAEIHGPYTMQAATGLVRGTGAEFNVPVMPIVRHLFFNQTRVDVEVTVWSVETGGLY